MAMDHQAAVLMLSLWASTAALLDWRHRRLPNVLTLGGFLFAAVWLAVHRQGPLGATPADALLGLAVAVALLLPGWFAGRLGAGDVKLAAAMGLIGGWSLLAETLIGAGLVAGSMALVVILRRGGMMALGFAPSPSVLAAAGTSGSRRILPLGTALAAGFVAALWGWRWLPT